MVEPIGVKGLASDRAVARVLATAAVAPVPAPASPPAGNAAADVASLSGVAPALAAKPPVDDDRVEQIKKALANGTFPILPATVADRLLALRYQWMTDDQA